jgi:phosphoribosyl-ATP pyrophosphohydrolase/phosphoribosyl-AMP cyclohydrolase
MNQPDFGKYADGLVPAIIQDAATGAVLMQGFMNAEAFSQTSGSGKVVFYSRSRKRLWMKGEESGNVLEVVSISLDCDQDCILVQAIPAGPVCHTGTDTCFEQNENPLRFLSMLSSTIQQRRNADPDTSYVAGLFNKGMNAIAQKVGEEAVELVIEAKDNDEQRFVNEAADLLFHYLVLLEAKDVGLEDVLRVLKERQR